MKKYDILLVNLNPTKGSEQRGIRPCLLVQNNFANHYGSTFVVCPISSVIKDYPHTLIVDPTEQNGLKKRSRIDILQIRTIDQTRIHKKIGVLDEVYREIFCEKFRISFDVYDEY